MPMYSVGQGGGGYGGGQSYGKQPMMNNNNNYNLGFGAPPRNAAMDFQIDGLPPEIQPGFGGGGGGGQPGMNNQLNDILNSGAQIRVKKVYHLQKTDDAVEFEDSKKIVTPMPPTPPPCNCENCLNKKQQQHRSYSHQVPHNAHPSPQHHYQHHSANVHHHHTTHHNTHHRYQPPPPPPVPEECNCHDCVSKRNCNCVDCVKARHGANCTCITCSPEIHKKKSVYQVHTKNDSNRYMPRNEKTDWYTADDSETSIPIMETPALAEPVKRNSFYPATPSKNPIFYSSDNSPRRNTGLGFNKHLKNSPTNPVISKYAPPIYEEPSKEMRKNTRQAPPPLHPSSAKNDSDSWSVMTDEDDRKLLSKLMK